MKQSGLSFCLSLCFENNLLLALDFLQFPCWDCLELFPFLVHCSVCFRNSHRLGHQNKLVHHILMSHRSKSCACNATSMFCRYKRFDSLPCGFMRFHHTATIRFGNCKHFRGASLSFPFARHGRCHGYFQFSPRISASLLPILVFSTLSGFTNFRPHFWPHMIWSGDLLNFCQSLPGPHVSFWRFPFQQSKLRETFP